jgi:hypothetical protein
MNLFTAKTKPAIAAAAACFMQRAAVVSGLWAHVQRAGGGEEIF